jgi:alcohol dehydrogenase (cytochrome c)
VNGQPRKVMIQANKNGFMYVLDRTNCKLIAAHAFVKVNWASSIDPTTGRPVLTDVYKRFLAGEEVEIYPSRGTNAVPISFDPSTGLIYASTWNLPRRLAPARRASPRDYPRSKPATPMATCSPSTRSRARRSGRSR